MRPVGQSVIARREEPGNHGPHHNKQKEVWVIQSKDSECPENATGRRPAAGNLYMRRRVCVDSMGMIEAVENHTTSQKFPFGLDAPVHRSTRLAESRRGRIC